jgi:monoamine oxidase
MYDVIIVGAGAAGLSAAKDLAASGRQVLILEARDRIGGRMYSTSAPGVPVAIELGAEFIHGRPAEIRWANKREMQGRRWAVENNILQPIQFNKEVEEILARLDGYTGADISFAAYLERYAKQATEESRDWATEYVEGFNAADSQRVGVHSLIQADRASEADDGQRLFCLNDGYGAFAESLLPKQADLILNAPVDEIRWSRGSVEIAGQRARAAIVTLPLAVLQSRIVRFLPELPQKTAAADRLAVGLVVRITFHFRERFWEPIAPELCMLHTHDPVFPTWWSALPDSTPVLTGWAAAGRAHRLSANSPDQNEEIALKSLSRLLKVDAVRYLVGAYTHDWTNDPFARGAYSYIPAGAMDAPAILAATVEDTLYFAGEATEVNGRGASVHGAIATGRRAAADILGTE